MKLVRKLLGLEQIFRDALPVSKGLQCVAQIEAQIDCQLGAGLSQNGEESFDLIHG